jgi:hypothetical protein
LRFGTRLVQFVGRAARFVRFALAPRAALPRLAAPDILRSPAMSLRHLCLAASSTAVLLATVPAWAETARGTAACPDLHQQLQQTLQPVVQDVALPGRVGVRLQLQGNRVLAVDTEGGPPAYHRAVKRAVRALGCAVPAGQVATLRFDIALEPAGAPALQRVARAELAD